MNTNQNDIQNSIALALQKLFSSSHSSQEEGGNRRESFDNVTAKDRDPFKTGLLRFSTDQTKVDIFTYLTHFTTTVCSYLNEQDKKKALIERICITSDLFSSFFNQAFLIGHAFNQAELSLIRQHN